MWQKSEEKALQVQWVKYGLLMILACIIDYDGHISIYIIVWAQR